MQTQGGFVAHFAPHLPTTEQSKLVIPVFENPPAGQQTACAADTAARMGARATEIEILDGSLVARPTGTGLMK